MPYILYKVLWVDIIKLEIYRKWKPGKKMWGTLIEGEKAKTAILYNSKTREKI